MPLTRRASAPINQKLAVSVVFVAAMFMNIMDITIINVALPTIGRQLKVGPTSVSAVAIGYLVSLAVTIPASGWLGDRFGLKKVLLTAIVIFTGASALCGAAQSFEQLVAFRVLQGVGGGMLTPVGMAMLFRAFPPEERVRASGILTFPTAFAPAIGPVLGGVLVDHLSWRWVFWVNLPLGILAVTFGVLFLEDPERHPAGAFDRVGFLLSGVGFASFMYGISEGPHRGWSDTSVLAATAVGAVLLVVMVRHQLGKRDPLLRIDLFRSNRPFRITNAVMFFQPAAFLGTLYTVALFFQDGLGLSAQASGLSTFPEAAGVMLGAQFASRVFHPRWGSRAMMVAGPAGVSVFVLLMTQIHSQDQLWWMRALMFCLGFSVAQGFTAAQATAFSRISAAETGRASTLFNAVRQLGGAVGVAVLSTSLAAVGVFHDPGRTHPNLTAYHVTFVVAAALSAIGALIATTLQDSRPDGLPGRAKKSEPVGEPIAI